MPFYQVRQTSVAAQSGIVVFNKEEKTASATAIDLIASNSARKSLSIINEANFELLVATGAVATTADRASATNKIKIIPPQTEYIWEAHELPLGALNGIWVGINPTGKALVVEGI